MSVDLAALPEIVATLPEKRRERILRAVELAVAKERAAERIPHVYPGMLKRYRTQRAQDETARALRDEGFGFVTGRFVQSVMREKR